MDSLVNQQIKLNDGRTLGFAEYGVSDGKPIFFFHGHPGSRLDWSGLIPDGVDVELNARVIAVDRPGHGLSDFYRDRKLLDWPDDVVELADALSLDRFAVLGVSGGGPYAAACAFKIPERLTATAIVCGMGPVESPGCKDGLSWIYAGKVSLTRRLLLMLTSIGLRKQPDKFISAINEGMKGPDKALILEKPELVKNIANGFGEAFRAGIAGVHLEAGLCKSPWGFRLQDISAEIHLWHGEQDDNVLVSVGRYVADAIPNCRTRFMEDEGHLTLIHNCVREYLSVLVV
jgi:pimeloyl-ACP methyl ester carboxylesterase